MYPSEGDEYQSLKVALEKLTLNDRSVTLQEESNSTLGRGWRLGFLGTLHMDVFKERLEMEYQASTLFTAPTVSYVVVFKKPLSKSCEKSIPEVDETSDSISATCAGPSLGSNEKMIQNMQEFPDVQDMATHVAYIKEPMILATVITPEPYIGQVMALCLQKRGVQRSILPLDMKRSILQFVMPLAEVIVDFYDQLKSITSGYARYSTR